MCIYTGTRTWHVALSPAPASAPPTTPPVCGPPAPPPICAPPGISPVREPPAAPPDLHSLSSEASRSAGGGRGSSVFEYILRWNGNDSYYQAEMCVRATN